MTALNSAHPDIQAVEFPPLAEAHALASTASMVRADAAFLKGVKVALEAHLGSVEMSVADLLALRSGSVVSLPQHLGDPIELRLNGSTVATGELVAVGNQFGVRIIEISELS